MSLALVSMAHTAGRVKAGSLRERPICEAQRTAWVAYLEQAFDASLIRFDGRTVNCVAAYPHRCPVSSTLVSRPVLGTGDDGYLSQVERRRSRAARK